MKLAGLPVNPFALPVYFAQGKWVRFITPKLPDAQGPTTGSVEGALPALRLIVIGDSTVAGVGATSHQTALTGQIAFHLAKATERTVHWRAVGQTHATTPIICTQLLPLLANESADVVVLSCGVNDTTRLHKPEQWRAHLEGLLTDLRVQFGTIPIIHAGVPPLEIFPALPPPLRQWIGARAKRFAQLAEETLTNDANGYYLAMPKELGQTGFARDGYHPSEESYAAWAEELVKYFLRTSKNNGAV